MDKIWEKIKAMAEDGDGFIRTSQVEGAGVSRSMLKKYMEKLSVCARAFIQSRMALLMSMP